MKTNRLGKMLAIPAFLLSLIFFARLGHAQAAEGFYHTSNGIVVDGNGDKAMMRGVGLGGWLMPEGYMIHFPGSGALRDMNQRIVDLIGEEDAAYFWALYRAHYVREKDVKMLAEWGYDHVRLPFHYNVIYDIETRSFKEEGFALFDTFLSWCKTYGLDVVLDLHATPGAQNSGPISDSDGQARLWTEPVPYQDMTVEIWEEIARRYVNEPAIIGYDLINEPVTPDEQLVNGQQDLRDLYGRLRDAIRLIDPNHILFIEGNYYATHFYLLDPAFDDNMVYAFHKYWNAPNVGTIQYLLDLRANTGVPLWLGETGENSNSWFFAVSRLAEANDIGWNWWTHKKIDSVTSPLSTPLLKEYRAVLDYFDGRAPKPSVDFAKEALFAQALALHIDQATLQPGVLASLFNDNFGTERAPYKNHVVPGSINAVDYDLGNQGVTYSDVDIWRVDGSPGGGNTGGKYRNDGVDIEASTDPEGFEYNVGWLSPFEWMEYTFDVTISGTYSLETRVASQSGGGNLEMMVDGQRIASLSVPQTGDWQSWTSVHAGGIMLTQGRHVLRVYVGRKGSYNLNRMTFTLVEATDVEPVSGPQIGFELQDVYPNPSRLGFQFELEMGKGGQVDVQLFDTLGKKVAVLYSGFLPPGSHQFSQNTQHLKPGLYFVSATSLSGSHSAPVMILH